ncbi:hypothetical protein NLJ89_g4013 [Agrocybe chaxingu]|uniref:F-box domain-containing protein n=1 Tax=Agrocybe chaxingu TaxID=84603 RepID=A0A9W8MY08_9AGAR|nr:hypothetical protein NLJ89_g4013 [Agrocybe chaxingu]
MNDPQDIALPPPELVDAIIREVDSKQALLNLRLTCKSFHEIATPYAFHTFDIPMKSNAKSLVIDFLEAPDLVKYVRKLRVNAQEGTKVFWDVVKDEEGNELVLYPEPYKETDLMFSRLDDIRCIFLNPMASFANVDTLCLYFPEVFRPEPLYEDENEDGWAYNLAYKICRSLRYSPLKYTLHTLEIQYLPLCDILLEALSSRSSSLTSLKITECLPKPYLTSKFWDSFTYARLQHLHLSKVGIKIEDSPSKNALETDLERFLLRHSGCIRTIRLDECLIIVEKGATPGFPRTWADVWRNIEENIPHLKRFKFEPAPRDPSYVSSGSSNYIGLSYGLWQWSPRAYFSIISGERDRAAENLPSERDDRAAWDRLQTTLEKRRKRSN